MSLVRPLVPPYGVHMGDDGPMFLAVLVLGAVLFVLGLVVALVAARRRSGSSRGAVLAGLAVQVVGALALAAGGVGYATTSGDEPADTTAGPATETARATVTRTAAASAPASDTPTGQPSRETVTITPSAAPAPARQQSPAASGDLGLSVPISRPACDGRGIVVYHSAVGNYASEVSAALAANPGASYLRTDQSCPSLRQRDEYGNVIYAVYRPSGYSKSQLCSDLASAPPNSYARWLDTRSDPSELVTC